MAFAKVWKRFQRCRRIRVHWWMVHYHFCVRFGCYNWNYSQGKFLLSPDKRILSHRTNLLTAFSRRILAPPVRESFILIGLGRCSNKSIRRAWCISKLLRFSWYWLPFMLLWNPSLSRLLSRIQYPRLDHQFCNAECSKVSFMRSDTLYWLCFMRLVGFGSIQWQVQDSYCNIGDTIFASKWGWYVQYIPNARTKEQF